MLPSAYPPVSNEMKDLPGTPNSPNRYPKTKWSFPTRCFVHSAETRNLNQRSHCVTPNRNCSESSVTVLSHTWWARCIFCWFMAFIFYSRMFLSWFRSLKHPYRTWKPYRQFQLHYHAAAFLFTYLRPLRWNEYISMLELQFDLMTFPVHTHAVFAIVVYGSCLIGSRAIDY